QGVTRTFPDHGGHGGQDPTPTAAPTPAPTATPTPAASAAPTAAPAPPPPPPSGGIWFGVLQATAPRAAQERAAGVTVGELELNWSSYEPAPGQFDAGYAAQQRNRMEGLRAA